MFRILIFILLLTAAAAGLTGLLAVDGNIHIQFGDWVYFNPAAPTLIAVSIFLVLLVVAVLLISYLMRLPQKLSAKQRESRRQRGIIALTRGLEAVAAGDATDAQRHAKTAQRQLEEPALTRLLTAQAAQLAGDHQTAEDSFAAMLEAPETEFLGLRGLYLQAVAAGDMKAAKNYADRAFKLRPNARWAYESVYRMSVERGAWTDAHSAMKLASRNGLEDGEHVKRHEAALLAARAHSAETSGDKADALKDAQDAVKLAPDFPPAAVLAARLQADNGNRSKAAKTLEQAWAARPHPAIHRAYLDLYPDLERSKRMAKLSTLSAKNPEAVESKQLDAEVALARGDYEGAKDILQPLFADRPTARTYTLMAAAMKGLYGEAAAEPWLTRAADAPPEPGPGADGTFHFTTDGWRRLVMEFGDHHRLAPPPLEEVSAALSQDEVLMLAAPPVKEEQPVPDTQEPVDADLSGEGDIAGTTPVTSPAAGPVTVSGSTGLSSEPSFEAEDTAGDREGVIEPAPADGQAAAQATSQGETPEEQRKTAREKQLKEAEAAVSAAGMGGGMQDES